MAGAVDLCTQNTTINFLHGLSNTVQVQLGPNEGTSGKALDQMYHASVPANSSPTRTSTGVVHCRHMLCEARIGGPDSPLRTRLAVNLTSVPYRLDMYFQNSLWRKTIWSMTAFSSGYYAANTVSLSFGALAINDVIAAATTVGFCEVVSRAYWSSPSPGLALVFLNYFKLGVIAALIADAFKLAG